MQPPLTSRRVLVVGASAGIGRSLAHHATIQGAHVCGAARREQHLMELCRASGAKGYVVGDVAELADCHAIVDGAVESLGGLDLVVYCAGTGTLAPIEQTEPARWAQDYAVNVIGAVQITAAALPHLDEHGLVAYVSSESTTEARWGMSSYSASKAALDASIRSWRLEHPERRFVRVVMGATMPTDFSAGFDAGVLATALHRWGEAGISPALMETDDVGRHLAELFGLLLNHPAVDVPDITLDPRGAPWPTPQGDPDAQPL